MRSGLRRNTEDREDWGHGEFLKISEKGASAPLRALARSCLRGLTLDVERTIKRSDARMEKTATQLYLHSSFFTLHYSFLTLHSSFFTLHYSFFILHSSLFIIHYSFFTNRKVVRLAKKSTRNTLSTLFLLFLFEKNSKTRKNLELKP